MAPVSPMRQLSSRRGVPDTSPPPAHRRCTGLRRGVGVAVAVGLGLVGTIFPPLHATTATSPVLAWGSNLDGRLGNGAVTNSGLPAPVGLPEGTTITAAAAGGTTALDDGGHSLAVTSAGQVLAWGKNGRGQLGDGTFGDRSTPVPVLLDTLPAGVTITAVAAGSHHSLGLTSAGQVLAWGHNNLGQLGDGTTSGRKTPGPVLLPDGVTVKAVAAGHNHSLALTETGQVLAWGYDPSTKGVFPTQVSASRPVPAPVSIPVPVTAVAVGDFHSLALTETGEVLAWGANDAGQLGNDTTTNSAAPVPATLPEGTIPVALAAGGNHSLALIETGHVLAWGANNAGQLGDGTTTNRPTPQAVALPAGTTATALAGGGSYSTALTSAGEMLAWGSNYNKQLGDGSVIGRATPVAVGLPAGTTFPHGGRCGEGPGPAVQGQPCIAAGLSHSLAVTASGQVLAWGADPVPTQFGDQTNHDSATPVVPRLPVGTTLTATAAGEDHNLALTSSRQVLAWGNNDVGQLGDGTTTGRSTPVPVNLPGLPAGATVTALAAGSRHSLALTSTGQILAWGANGSGQLGDGTTTGRTTPVAVPLPEGTTVTRLAAGGGHSLALTSSGQVLGWGANSVGQLGDDTLDSSSTPGPVIISAGTTVTAVAAGQSHSLALTSAGQVLAWGANGSGQLGDDTIGWRSTAKPVGLPEGTTVTGVAGGQAHSLALTSTGGVLAWGAGGTLGDGTTARRSTPAPVSLPERTTVTAVAAQRHSLALTSSGQVLAWGGNNVGQLGDGTTTSRLTPAPVALPEGTTVKAVSAGSSHSLALPGRIIRSVADFDGNAGTDAAIFRPGSGQWYARGVLGLPVAFGTQSGDVPVPGDYNGDKSTDVAIFRPSTGQWFVKDQFTVIFGTQNGDVPVPGDYNGDKRTDVAIFRPSTGQWSVKDQFTVTYGTQAGDLPVPGDYNGDGTTDVAIFRKGGSWFVRGNAAFPVTYGSQSGDVPVPGDYNGDASTDVAVFRSGIWLVKDQFSVSYGTQPGDLPVPGDYNGDGSTDVAVFRAGSWFVHDNAEFPVRYGTQAGDVPLQLPYAIRGVFFPTP